ncbi:cupin-like domain-containing protein [Nostoc sp. DedQUE07]|uniref:cupin-like domain-containing protein n=1 Tax=Nostoc sp. DedQUE07 TaxID=3075392 RepID=UPI002AD3B68B|nr:cupin-like domain-containing protein [Nostoc sp. DedQUE07]MDZ8128067.1 cupin-like domain-containing protein [Nostoc sp. DedQUE07]
MIDALTPKQVAHRAEYVGVFMQIQANESILKIKSPSTKQFSELLKQYHPFIIKDVAQYWDACNNWTNDYLIKKCGNNLVPVRFFKKDFWQDYKNFAYEDGYETPKEMKLEEYINNHIEDRVSKNNNIHSLECYLNQAYFEERFPEIIGDITYPEYFNRKAFVMLWFGLSSKSFSSNSPLHFDLSHNLFAQIRGRKRVLLFPPSNYLSFYPPLEARSGAAYDSKVNPDLLNLELFPKFPWQEKIEFVLQPGEILYLPPFWWHRMTAVDDNISLSFWYDVKIQDFFWQKNMLSVFLKTAPYYLYHSISVGNLTFKDFMIFLRQFLIDALVTK